MGYKSGWLFRRRNNNRARMADYRDELFAKIKELQKQRPDLIPAHDQVRAKFGTARSLRRGAVVEARNQKVSKKEVEAMNRWES
mmetsp:Transcript_28257/g.83229  ORF Transcript_28257/g.83229 Transcript_28257/m.83229 type:complete len:84 (-) Transcript_28257:571-822(-)